MTKIKTSYFCGLSSQPKLVRFLKELDVDLHDWFIKAHSESTGCKYNTELMLQLVEILRKDRFKFDQLLSFLKSHFPSALSTGYKVDQSIFVNYKEGVFTLPRRVILLGVDIEDCYSFCSNKHGAMFLFRDGVGYIEFVEYRDLNISNKLKWILEDYKDAIEVRR